MSSATTLQGTPTRFGGGNRPPKFSFARDWALERFCSIASAPPRKIVELKVSDGHSEYSLPFPCALVNGVWMNARCRKPIATHLVPVGWKWRSW